MIEFMVNHAPGSYVIGVVLLAVGGGLLWHVIGEQARARRSTRRRAIARQQALTPHPAGRHRPVRVVRRVTRGVAPVPRPAPDSTGTLPGLDGAMRLTPTVGRADGIPGQRGASRG
ncbi:hypothetical protein [Micromonospora costi]|uniref:Uncharacterized protein n=1 Tax=Micromonospora costi TaxID=1530042 RepID=A0A3B0A657_9ACTN|nr:hypothetical protein [Micromonospora costi]RKN55901.1 hypothetical protein D7193_15025 [Micromonospora costi]